MVNSKAFIGEIVGTFIMVSLGCGSVAVTILFGTFSSLWQIALVWGFAVALAIYLSRKLSNAHLNPAVSLGMILSGRMDTKQLPTYLTGQVFGAFLAGLALYLSLHNAIAAFESANSIVRGSEASMLTARMFGEFYAGPGSQSPVSLPIAITAEGLGTFLLLILIYAFTERTSPLRPKADIAPIFIGLSVSAIILMIAPYTQAGINPARDFGPRMVAWIFGWSDAAFPDRSGGFFWVYILAPIVGGVLASFLFIKGLEPVLKRRRSVSSKAEQ